MKTSLAFLIFCCITGFSFAQHSPDTGIHFFKGTYAALLQEAQLQHKMIFIDVYTDWCGPCKGMDKFIFPLQEVGNKYNPRFLNYKLNAEKGEGIQLAKKFNITAYPTFLYLNSNGYLVHKVIGERDAPVFISQVDKVMELANDKNQLGNLEAAFTAGNREPAFLRTYIMQQFSLNIDNSHTFDAWLKVVPAAKLKKEPQLLFIGRYLKGTNTNALAWIMQHYAQLSDTAKAIVTPRLFYEVAERAIPVALRDKNIATLQPLISYVQQLGTANQQQESYMNRIYLMYAGLTKDTALLKKNGYIMVGNLMELTIDSIHAEDARRYTQIMAPFLSGAQDSTKVPDFQEQKALVVNTYSRDIYMRLFTAASAFGNTLHRGDKALEDALQWATRADQLIPNIKENTTLIMQLKSAMQYKASISSSGDH
ncbi:MAG: thioredoxin family protein [Chitinophaga sp.]|uniref:thioredoxin family protein n=1 Tax=Chitinophaga sp. TaxID=1869181 RepID=UPI001B1820EE|nr:thioredoxin family protein [Chitinophaga sp.]MBO9732772.1 thioredoxin family protein [Chitinophaga sp.]